MTLTLPTYVSTHKGDASRRYFWLLEIAATGATPLVRITDCAQDITYGGIVYSAGRGFRVSGMQSNYSGLGEFTLSIDNGDGVFSGYLAVWVGPDAHPKVTVTEVWFDAATSSLTVEDGYEIAGGVADALSWDDTSAGIRVIPSAISAQLLSHGMRWERDLCTYRAFKGPECGYAGSTTTCDRTAKACSEMSGGSNIARFGGVRSGIDGFLYEVGQTRRMWFTDFTFTQWMTER